MPLDLSLRACPFIIGEAGTNHASPIPEKRLDKALAYVEAAGESGVDAIKFQMFKNPIPDDMFCWIPGDVERSKRWADSELSLDEWRIVKQSAEARGMEFLASPFQYSTVCWLNDLGVCATKVASRATTRFPYHMAPTPWLISTGMGLPHPDWINAPYAFLIECESNYPSTAFWCGQYPGFSDHSATPERAIDAMKRGCKLIEVHFYIDPADAGPDLPASLTIDQLKTLSSVRNELAVEGKAA